MAAALADRASRSSSPESVEADLAALWRELADRGPVARAVMSNLIVCRQEHVSQPDQSLDAVMASHPSRTIVLEHGWHDEPAPVVDAGVSVCIFGDAAGRYGVEQIVIRATSTDASLASIVRRFIRGNLPTSFWWTDDLSRRAPLPALLDTSRQLIFDSRAWSDVAAGVRVLAPIAADDRIDLADLNWRRLAPVRRALAHGATGIDETLSGADVAIAHRAGDAALAWLLAGSLASALGWTNADPWPAIREVAQDEILTVTIDTGASGLTLVMNDHRVSVEQPGVPAQVTAVPQIEEAATIAAELRSLSRDRSFHQALSALVARVVQS